MNVLFALILAVSAVCAETVSPVLARSATAEELVENCRTMIPSSVELAGRIILRSRRGIPMAEYKYRLARRGAQDPSFGQAYRLNRRGTRSHAEYAASAAAGGV